MEGKERELQVQQKTMKALSQDLLHCHEENERVRQRLLEGGEPVQ